MNKKVIILTLSYLMSFIMIFNNISYNVEAGGIAGDYYFCNFEEYAIGDKNISESVSGNTWLTIDSCGYGLVGVADENSQNVYIIQNTNIASQIGYFNLSIETVFINYTVNTTTEGASQWDYYQTFYKANNEQLFKIEISNDNGNSEIDYVVYDENDNVEATVTNGGNLRRNIDITLNVSTSEININISTDGEGINVWFPISNFDYVTSIKMNCLGSNPGGRYVAIDDFYIDSSDAGFLWDNSYSYYGSVIQQDFNYLSLSFMSQQTYVVETQNRNFGRILDVKQLALVFDDGSDVDHFDVYARVGDESLGQQTNVYSYANDRYVYVWENLDVNIQTSSIGVEFKIIGDAGSYNANIGHSSSDIDGDGDTEYYYSVNGNYFNGAYDGVIQETERDLLYQIWYSTTETEGTQYGDVSNYTASDDIFNQNYAITQINNKNYVEWKTNIKTEAKVYGLDVLITDAYYETMQDFYSGFNLDAKDYMFAYFSGTNVGNPDYILPFTDDIYIVRWIFNAVTLNNTEPYIELKLPSNPNSFYYEFGEIYVPENQIQIITATYDFDGDGDNYFYAHNYGTMFGNGGADGTKIHGSEPIYRFWYIKPTLKEKDYSNDAITTDRTKYQQYDVVSFDAVTKNPYVTNSIHAYHYNGATWDEYDIDTYEYAGMPQEFQVQDSYSGSFVPTLAGQWNITLEYNNNIHARQYFNVTSKSVNYAIITLPNPSKTTESVKIYAIYNISDSMDVRIAIKDKNDKQLNAFTIHQKQTLYHVGTYTFKEEGLYNINMERRYDSTFDWGTVYVYKHIAKAKNYKNWIGLEYEDFSSMYLNTVAETIYYTHNHLGSNKICILINDGDAGSFLVGDKSIGEVYFYPQKTGTYEASLVILNDTGNHEYLYNATFTYKLIEKQDLDDGQILPNLGVTMGAIVGLIVTMFCTLSPLLVTKGLKSKHSVPPIVYAFTCCLGISVSVLLGFFPFWIIPFIVIIGVIILMIQYIINGGGSKGD